MLASILFILTLCLTVKEKYAQDFNISFADGLIAAKPGFFVIGGLFQIGKHNDNSVDNDECTYEKASFFGIQKAIFLRHLIDKVRSRFEKDFNKSIGYEIYDTCSRFTWAMRASTKLSQNNLVVGVSGVDRKDYIKESVLLTTAFHIPTFVYMYNDDDLMDTAKFPTLFSLIDTEVKEAKITIQYLNLMKFRFMDIWYHPFSKEMAEYIHNKYTSQNGGCGRIKEIHKAADVPKIGQTLEITGGMPSDVQLILSNNLNTTKTMLKYMVEELKFQNKVYVFGFSVGREKYLDDFSKIVTSDLAGNSSLIFVIPELSNSKAEVEKLKKVLNKNWSKIPTKDRIDEIYAMALSQRFAEGKNFDVSNWLPHVEGGLELIVRSLYENLKNQTGELNPSPVSLRQKVYHTIINENRNVRIDSTYLSADLKLADRTLNSGYQIGVYQSHTGKYEILGRVFPDTISITNEELLQKTSIYQQSCSNSCPPGSYRLFEENTFEYLPCCWTCAECHANHFSTEFNQNFCQQCDPSEVSTDDKVACVNTSETYIKPGSAFFIAGVCLAPLGLAMAMFCGVVIFLNEERPTVKASEPTYLYIVLLSLGIAYGGCFIPILKPSPYTCTAEYFTFVIFATMISVNLLFKCIKIYEIFAASKNFRRPRFSRILKKSGHTGLNITALLVNISLLLIDSYTGNGPSWTFYRIQDYPHTSWNLMCSVSNIGNIIPPLVLPAASFLATLWLAFKMRSFPHNFRETINIFFATFVVSLCSVMFLGGYTLSPSTICSFLRCVVIFITSTAFLFCLFVPRILLLLQQSIDLETERNQVDEDVQKFHSRSQRMTLSGTGRAVVFSLRSSKRFRVPCDNVTTGDGDNKTLDINLL